jgi:hypothetical protein
LNSSRIPNLFLAGAPKCGTTSLVNWLSSTGNVFVPLGREPHFFANDIFPDRVCNSLNRYQNLYKHASNEFKYLLDGSTGYLSSKEAIPNILSICPNAKFILMVRDPSEMVVSLHRERVTEGREKILSTREAWSKCNENRELALNYKFQCDLANQIKTAQSLISSSNLLILSLKELSEEPKKTYEKMMDFLNLTVSSYPSFQIYGEAITRKSLLLQSLIFSVKKVRQRLNIPSVGVGLFKWLEQKNTIKKRAVLNDPKLLNDLKLELSIVRNELLSILKDRDECILEEPL